MDMTETVNRSDVAETRSRRGFAMAIMIASSIGISFGGLVLRSMDDADAWQINFYRSLALVLAIMSILPRESWVSKGFSVRVIFDGYVLAAYTSRSANGP